MRQRLFALTIALSICLPALAQNAESRAQELLAIADHIFKDSNASLDADARRAFERLVIESSKKIDTPSQMQEARISMARLAQAMVDCSPDSPCPTTSGRIVLRVADLKRALKKLCPLYPFC